jgi:hypothetical protein
MQIKWSGLELCLIELERELAHGGGAAAALLPSAGAARPAPAACTCAPTPAHGLAAAVELDAQETMTAATSSALSARLSAGMWPEMTAEVHQQVCARIRTAKSWTNLMREWGDDSRLRWEFPALEPWFAARMLLVEMGPWLDDLRS